MGMTSALSVFNWSTEDVPDGQRYEYYAHALASAMFPIQVGQKPDDYFAVDMVAADIGGMTVIRQRGTPHRCYADKGNIAGASQRTFHLLVNGSSTWTMDHMGRHRLNPGDILLSDSSIPFEINILADFDFVNLSLSEVWIRQWLPAPALMVGRRINGQGGWGQALAAFVRALQPAQFPEYPLPISFVADHIGALLALVAQDLCTPAVRSPKRDDALFERLRDCIYQQSSHVDLTAASVAAGVGVSLRTLHRCFARFDTTFGDTLMNMRCASAVRMLESPIFRRLTVAEIGRRAGFADASHFARTLHARIGKTPTQVRRQNVAMDSGREVDREED